MEIRLKRAYDSAARSDGPRILVDRIWPRGVAKDDADIAQTDWEHTDHTELTDAL
ncbi:DUF488 family protein [Marinobacter lipolyticus]|uniref:DUF488 family protein, N3 subclade n=1 Tax=Marinobacter lipolyticus TaxID=209639 RepID=UPI001D190DC3|nr:DUF488 family protein [Marinobacter lipolyticus]